MRIKGIDLYKRALEKDKSVLGKRFFNSDGKRITILEHANLEGFGVYEDGGDNILMSAPQIIERIMLAEWEEAQEPVDFMTAINSGKKIRPQECYCTFLDLYGIQELFNGLDEDIMLKYINGKWIIE